MIKKILILGASGFIGGYLLKHLVAENHHVIGSYHNHPQPSLIQINMLDIKQVENAIIKHCPDIVLFLSGTKDVALCERDAAVAIDLNVHAVRNYITACEHTNILPKTIFFSTDYVFDGVRGHYCNSDAVSPNTIYGMTNALAERVLIESSLAGIVLRVSAVMGKIGGFFRWFEQNLYSGKPFTLYDNTFFSPTSIGHLCKFITNYINSYLDHISTMQVMHLSDGYRLTRYQFGCAIAICLGQDASTILPVHADTEHTTFHHDLSLIPDGMVDFFPNDKWNEMENIY